MDINKSKTGLEMKYFVLKPKGHNPYAKASRFAMASYADYIEKENYQLATELRAWVLEEELKEKELKRDGCGCGYCKT